MYEMGSNQQYLSKIFLSNVRERSTTTWTKRSEGGPAKIPSLSTQGGSPRSCGPKFEKRRSLYVCAKSSVMGGKKN